MSQSSEQRPGVEVVREGGVATVRLNRPEAMNSLDVATKESLRDAVREVGEDPEVRCVVLTGSGRAFCVGQDLKEHIGLLADGAESLFRTVPEHYNPTVLALATMPKPVIAAVNGVAAGAGASLAFAADYRLVADTDKNAVTGTSAMMAAAAPDPSRPTARLKATMATALIRRPW